MQLTKKQKEEIISLFKMVDVKKLEIDTDDDRIKKYFRFGSFDGLSIASEIIKSISEKKDAKPKKVI